MKLLQILYRVAAVFLGVSLIGWPLIEMFESEDWGNYRIFFAAFMVIAGLKALEEILFFKSAKRIVIAAFSVVITTIPLVNGWPAFVTIIVLGSVIYVCETWRSKNASE